MTLPADYNPFQSYNVEIPKQHLDRISRYSRTKSDEGTPKLCQDSPFRRYIDIWVLALIVGRSANAFLSISDVPDRHSFIPGTIFAKKLEIIELIFAIAIDREDSHEVVLDSRKSFNIALSYAAGGLPLLFNMLETGAVGTPLDRLVINIQDAIKDPSSLSILSL